MLKTPELAMPRTNKVTTVCNGRRKDWTEYEQAKAYFLENFTGWKSVRTRTNKTKMASCQSGNSP